MRPFFFVTLKKKKDICRAWAMVASPLPADPSQPPGFFLSEFDISPLPKRCDRVVKCVTSVIWPHRCLPRSGMSCNPLIKTEGPLFENRIYWTNMEVDPALVSLPSQACLQNCSSYITICVSASKSLSPLTFVSTQSLCKETLPPPLPPRWLAASASIIADMIIEMSQQMELESRAAFAIRPRTVEWCATADYGLSNFLWILHS